MNTETQALVLAWSIFHLLEPDRRAWLLVLRIVNRLQNPFERFFTPTVNLNSSGPLFVSQRHFVSFVDDDATTYE